LPADAEPLKPRLRSLLARAAQIETGDFLQTLPKLDLSGDDLTPPAPTPADRAGDLIGPYRLVRELGTGGMGVVWLAERVDGLIARPVALKLPHGAWKRAGLAERMAREREILATLTHPNIAHLYDAGLAADGQPYLAIEYVEGRGIDVHCDANSLNVRARLRLFVQVADAVAYAHAKLIVHRDLKPANILVDADGRVRLLDFGIAKLLEDGEARETRLTELSGRALTPDYASPEQLRGEPLTIASDVYSLGVVLYELLCGRRPYKLARDSRGALEDAILQAEPTAPSRVVPPARRRELRGDLDTIVLKALKKKPEERYATVHALADDIARHNESRPVLAQPDSGWYRGKRFLTRNKIAVTIVGSAMALIVTGSIVVAWQARVALAEKARAEEVKEFIAAIFRESDPYQSDGKILTAVDLMRQAERRLKESPSTDPAVRLELLTILGESLLGLQQNQEAARVLEEALRLLGTLPRDVTLEAKLRLFLSEAREYLGDHDASLRELQLALSILAASGMSKGTQFIEAKWREAGLGLALANYPLAESAARDAVNAAVANGGPNSLEVADGLEMLSQAQVFSGQRKPAVDSARRAFDIKFAMHGRAHNHPAVIDSEMVLGRALAFSGEFEDAYAHIRGSTDRAAALFGKDSMMVGYFLSSCAPLEIERGDLRTAADSAQRALDIYVAQAAPGTPAHAGRVRSLGEALLAARSVARAATVLEEAVHVSAQSGSKRVLLYSRGSLGLAHAYLGRFDTADSELHAAIDEAGPQESRAQLVAMRNLGVSLHLQGRFAEAMVWLEKAVAAASIHRNERGELAHALLEMGSLKLAQEDHEAAGAFFDRAELLFRDVQGPRTTPARAELLVGMARVRMQRKDFSAALPLLERADEFWRSFAPDNRWAGAAALWLGRCELALGRGGAGKKSLARAAKLLARSPISEDVRLMEP
jgi:eukaryotic-like serine/threonine-protein kinase